MDDDEVEEVPADVLSVYNSTVEQNTNSSPSPEREEEEEYYAKEVHRFNMTRREYILVPWLCHYDVYAYTI